VKVKFVTNRGNRGIFIKYINDIATRFASKLIDCKLLRNYRKEEAPTRFIAVAVQ
jgi:hypothetical protein